MKLLRRAFYILRHQQAEADLAEEMAFHESMVRRDMLESGASATEAAAAGRRTMGNPTISREDARAVWIWPWLESIWQDLSYGARTLRRDAGFTLVAVGALALAIGLNTSLFTVFNAVALRPWPVKDPGSVVTIYAIDKNPPKGFDAINSFSPAEERYLAEHSKTMSGMFLTRGEGGLHLDKAPKTRVEYTSGNYFSVLGVDMERGRGFLPEEDRVDSPAAVLVLSHSIWQNRYGGDPAIIGRRLQLDDIPFTVVGVTSDRFRGTDPEATDIWLPMASGILLHPNDTSLRDFLTKPGNCCLDMAGRIATGFTREQARAELSVLHADFEREQLHATADGVWLAGTPILQKPGRKIRAIFAVFSLIFAGVMMVLLLACANVGNLLLARAAARRREIGVRLSLGAGRWRIVRQLLTESLALAVGAAALGLVLAYILPAPLFQRIVGEVSFYLRPDATVLAYSLGLAVFACLAFGLAPALHATRGSFSDALRRRHPRVGHLRGLLLTVQVTLSVILLVGAGLLIRGIQRVRSQDPGFAINGVAGIAFDFPISAYGSARMNAFFTGIEQGLRELPGAPPPGWTLIEPLGSQRRMFGVRLPNEDQRQQRPILANSASAGYFEVLHIPILAGRNFERADAARKVVLVNQAFAERYFPGESPLGKNIFIDRLYEIVGVVGNAYVWDLNQVEPCLFTPVTFDAAPRLLTAQTPANLALIAALAKNLDPRVQLRVTPLQDNYDRWLDSSRMGAAIAGLLGVLALVLASIGIAGVFAYAVQQRTQEIGIRIALGARPANVVGVVVGSGARSLVAGLVLGVSGALAASTALQQYLYGLNRLDPITYAAVLITLGCAGLAATYLPARRAVKLDPMRALHYE